MFKRIRRFSRQARRGVRSAARPNRAKRLTLEALEDRRLLAADVQFTDVSDALGIGSDLYDGSSFHALGVNWIDYNNDGWSDMFLVNGQGLSPHLFRNDGGTFTPVDELLPALPDVEMMGSVYADYDNDGDTDIYVYTDDPLFLNQGKGAPPNLLLKNLWVDNGNQVIPGQPLFEEVGAFAGVDDLMEAPRADGPAFNTPAAVWLDYDRDGFVDLFVAHWANVTDTFAEDKLYRNKGDGTFEDVTDAMGINPSTSAQPYGFALVTIAAHLNDDLWPDIYVGNILDIPQDMIYQNQGGTGFIDQTPGSPGVGDDAPAAMGITVGDIDLDGDWDMFISDIDGLPFYENTGTADIMFNDDSAPAAGIVANSSWGVNFFDADHDGYEDLFIAQVTPTDRLYLNDQDGTFTDISDSAGPFDNGLTHGRGSAVADFDHDGDLDIAVVNEDGELQLFQNDSTGLGHWLQVKLEGTASNRDAIGAVVRVTAGGKQMMRQVTGGNSAHSQDQAAVHFGLDDATQVDLVEILWPSGAVDQYFNVSADQMMTIVEDAANIETIQVRGQGWGTDLIDYFAAADLGSNGYAIDIGAGAPPEVLPWELIDQIEVIFSEDVTIAQSDLALSGIDVATYGFLPEAGGGFNYDPVTFTATWTLDQTIDTDHVTVELNAAAILDGSDNALSGPAAASFKVLVGDASGDEIADAGDYTLWANSFGLPMDPNVARADFSANGSVGPEDYTLWSTYFGSVMPAPVESASMSSSSAELRGAVSQPSVKDINAIGSEYAAANNVAMRGNDFLVPSASHTRSIGGDLVSSSTAALAIHSRVEDASAGIIDRSEDVPRAAEAIAPRVVESIDVLELVDAAIDRLSESTEVSLAESIAVPGVRGDVDRSDLDPNLWDAALEELLNPDRERI